MSTKTILFLAQLPPPIHGVSMMSKQVFDIITTSEDYDVDYLWSGGAKSFKDINKKSFGKIFSFAKLIWVLLYRFVSGKRYDIAYITFAPWTHAAIRDGLIAWFAGLSAKRVLLHLHGEGLQAVIDQNSKKDKLLVKLISNTELIAITANSAQRAKQSGLFSAIYLLPNFVTLPKQQPKPRHDTAPKQEGRPLKIAFLGNLDPRKGVLIFLDFIAAMDQQGLSITAEIVGAPTQFLTIEDVIEAAKARKIADLVSVPGAKYDKDKTDFLSASDIFLYPTQHDYAPLVLIEAMSLRTIPIVYDTGGISEMVGAGFADHVITPRLPATEQNQKVVELVRQYSLNHALMAQDKDKAFQIYQNQYTQQKFITNFLSILAAPQTPK